MGYDQWVSITNTNTSDTSASPTSAKIQNVTLTTGKFYYMNDKDYEIPVSDIEGHELAPGDKFVISSCGPSADSPDGTKGTYQIVDESTGDVITNVRWDCPGGGQPNDFGGRGGTGSWMVEIQGSNAPGPLGDVSVTLIKI